MTQLWPRRKRPGAARLNAASSLAGLRISLSVVPRSVIRRAACLPPEAWVCWCWMPKPRSRLRSIPLPMTSC